jgi:uncharacterized membrane protein
VVIAALGLIVIVGFIALAVDVGHLRYVKRQLQTAADAAALAGALEIIQCNGAAVCSAMQSAAQSSLVENGLTGSTVVINCATTVVSGLELTINNGPCSHGSQDPNSGNPNYVEILLTQPQTTYFAKVLGISSTPMTVRSEALRSDGGVCVYALDKTGSNAFVINSGATLNSTCGVIK